MIKADYRFGDVVEWEVGDGKTIRWFIIGGRPRSYEAICVQSPNDASKFGEITNVGAKGAEDETLLNG